MLSGKFLNYLLLLCVRLLIIRILRIKVWEILNILILLLISSILLIFFDIITYLVIVVSYLLSLVHLTRRISPLLLTHTKLLLLRKDFIIIYSIYVVDVNVLGPTFQICWYMCITRVSLELFDYKIFGFILITNTRV